MYGVHMDREWGAGEGHKKKGFKSMQMWMLKRGGLGVKLNIWTSTRKKINYEKRKIFVIL